MCRLLSSWILLEKAFSISDWCHKNYYVTQWAIQLTMLPNHNGLSKFSGHFSIKSLPSHCSTSLYLFHHPCFIFHSFLLQYSLLFNFKAEIFSNKQHEVFNSSFPVVLFIWQSYFYFPISLKFLLKMAAQWHYVKPMIIESLLSDVQIISHSLN